MPLSTRASLRVANWAQKLAIPKLLRENGSVPGHHFRMGHISCVIIMFMGYVPSLRLIQPVQPSAMGKPKPIPRTGFRVQIGVCGADGFGLPLQCSLNVSVGHQNSQALCLYIIFHICAVTYRPDSYPTSLGWCPVNHAHVMLTRCVQSPEMEVLRLPQPFWYST